MVNSYVATLRKKWRVNEYLVLYLVSRYNDFRSKIDEVAIGSLVNELLVIKARGEAWLKRLKNGYDHAEAWFGSPSAPTMSTLPCVLQLLT